MKTKVVNLRKEPFDVYIGRAGRGRSGYFGNPVIIGKKCPVCCEVHRNGGSTLPCYTECFNRRMARDLEFRRRICELRGKTLGCFCKPGPCHGDVIVAWLNANPNQLPQKETPQDITAAGATRTYFRNVQNLVDSINSLSVEEVAELLNLTKTERESVECAHQTGVQHLLAILNTKGLI